MIGVQIELLKSCLTHKAVGAERWTGYVPFCYNMVSDVTYQFSGWQALINPRVEEVRSAKRSLEVRVEYIVSFF